MNSFEIYNDIATRTGGNIYIGVVGPVRTGKSTFISKVLNTLVLPNILDPNDKERALDEIPQSGDGKSIMTTQPHFVPNEAVKVSVSDNLTMNVRLVDCVGYMVDGALGDKENGVARTVMTPWTDSAIPFPEAAELGTNKVIDKHSTIGIMITTDGSISGIDRASYEKSEARVIETLNKSGKPYVIVLNTTHPDSPETKALVQKLSNEYSRDVLALDVKNLDSNGLDTIFVHVLDEFPLVCVDVDMPDWLKTLPADHEIISEIRDNIMSFTEGVAKVGDLRAKTLFEGSENFEETSDYSVEMGEGRVIITITPKQYLFYKVISNLCGEEISSDFALVNYIKELSSAKRQFDKLSDALQSVNELGYGVVYPTDSEITFNDPEITKISGKQGVKLTATAPSLHIMRVDMTSEVSPFLGSEQQSGDMTKYLMETYETDKQAFWDTKMFGKTLHDMVCDDINSKLNNMPKEAMKKMKKTLTRIVNEGKGGVICILL